MSCRTPVTTPIEPISESAAATKSIRTIVKHSGFIFHNYQGFEVQQHLPANFQSFETRGETFTQCKFILNTAES